MTDAVATTDPRSCDVPGCTAPIPVPLLRLGIPMCLDHWHQVPLYVQRRVYAAHRRLASTAGSSEAYRDAVTDAVKAVALSAPAPRDCRHEPAYPGSPTVVTSLAGGVVHLPTGRCAIEGPHEWENCSEVSAPAPEEEPR